jgi:hypothetical protein
MTSGARLLFELDGLDICNPVRTPVAGKELRTLNFVVPYTSALPGALYNSTESSATQRSLILSTPEYLTPVTSQIALCTTDRNSIQGTG